MAMPLKGGVSACHKDKKELFLGRFYNLLKKCRLPLSSRGGGG